MNTRFAAVIVFFLFYFLSALKLSDTNISGSKLFPIIAVFLLRVFYIQHLGVQLRPWKDVEFVHCNYYFNSQRN